MKKALIFVFCILVVFSATHSWAGIIFSDNFSGDSSKWTFWSNDGSYTMGITGSDGNPAPGVLLDDYLSYGAYARTIQKFTYVGKTIEFQGDIKQGSASFSDQRFATLLLFNNDGGNYDYFLRVGVIGSSNPNQPNTVFFEMIDSTGSLELSSYLPIANGDGWHTAKIKIRPDQKVEFYFDGTLAYTSVGMITPNYDGTMTLGVGGRKSYYDNMQVNDLMTQPTPVGYNPQWLMVTLVSLIGAGGFILRRITARQ